MKSKRPLTAEEIEAVNWAKANYPHWRKRHNITLEAHMTHRPYGVSEDTWKLWYEYPFGNEEFNKKHRIVKQLLLDKVI